MQFCVIRFSSRYDSEYVESHLFSDLPVLQKVETLEKDNIVWEKEFNVIFGVKNT